ncbi:chitin deacetylase 7-like isoform X2 [Haemaphysalis longicornis]
MRFVGFKRSLFHCAVILSLLRWLGSSVMAADISRQHLSSFQRRDGDEPGCTKERLVECTRIGAACMQPKGECVCISWKKMINGSCQYVSTAATEISPWSSEFTRKDRAPDVFRTTSAPKEEATTATETREWTSDTTPRDTTPRVTIGTTISTQGTGKCDDKVCKRPRCVCASDSPPAGLRVDEMPQFVMLTFDDAVTVLNMAFYRELLNITRRKHKQNGCSIAATFFVSGEYLDYEAVNQLHSWGNEIALHSISHRTDPSYWQTINSTQWEREVLDQRTMLTAFANVSAADVVGFRGPFLFTGGDQGFSMLHKHLRYDSTLPHHRGRGERPFYPYTMNFGFRRSCNVLPCPQGSYPGLWVLPMNVFFAKSSNEDHPCVMADTCAPPPDTANDTFEYLKSNFEYFYTTNRAPFPVFLHEAYLRHPERKVGYLRFIDWLLEKDDVYLVTASEVLRFMEDPKPLSAYAKRSCAGRNVRGPSTCPRPTTCSYKNTPPGGERYMRTCSQCPKNYPWVNNPLGN